MARGSVFRRSGRWAYRVDIGPNPETGKRRQMLKQGFATKKEAEAALAQTLRDSLAGTAVGRSTVNVEGFLKEWLETSRSRLRPATHHGYTMSVAQINRHLGSYRLQSLTPLQIERFYADLLAGGGRDGKALSPRSVRNIHVVLRKALADAERLGLVARNAAGIARPPAVQRPEFVTWSLEELQTFLAAVKHDRLYIAYVLLATTGMRRGEVLGLRWSDIDFAGSQLAVTNTLTTGGYDTVMGPPKTPRGRRHVYLDPHTVALLEQHRDRQRAERKPLGISPMAPADLVVCDELGRPVHPDIVTKAFARAVASLDVPRIRLHDVCHTYATLALKAGVHPKIMSERLGHSTVSVTLDVYSHVVPSIARDAADLVASHIFETES